MFRFISHAMSFMKSLRIWFSSLVAGGKKTKVFPSKKLLSRLPLTMHIALTKFVPNLSRIPLLTNKSMAENVIPQCKDTQSLNPGSSVASEKKRRIELFRLEIGNVIEWCRSTFKNNTREKPRILASSNSMLLILELSKFATRKRILKEARLRPTILYQWL